jgi:hypothetical protein
LDLIAKFEESEVKTDDEKKGGFVSVVGAMVGCASIAGALSATGVLVIAAALCLKKKEN